MYLPTPPLGEGCDTRSIFKQSLTSLFSFSYTGCQTKTEESSLTFYLTITGRRITGFILFLRVNGLIGLVVRVFANGPSGRSSIPGHVIPKTLKMVLDTTKLNTQHYKVRIKGKVDQSRERSSALPYTLVL